MENDRAVTDLETDILRAYRGYVGTRRIEPMIAAINKYGHEEFKKFLKRHGPSGFICGIPRKKIDPVLQKAGMKIVTDLLTSANDLQLKHAALTRIENTCDDLDKIGNAADITLRPGRIYADHSRMKIHDLMSNLQMFKEYLDHDEHESTSISELKSNTDRSIEDLPKAQKFDLRSIQPQDVEVNGAFAADLEKQGILINLPYECCWFEWDVSSASCGNYTVGAIIYDSTYDVAVCVDAGRGWSIPVRDDDDRLRYLSHHIRSVIRAALVIISSKTTVKHDWHASDKLNKARADKGKLPLYSHTIIEIRGIISRDRSSGNEVIGRRSPRMHWRRGHMRHLRNGAIIPIPPVLVNVDAEGFIEHDYRLSSNLSGDS